MSVERSKQVEKPALGVFRGTRPRPTYAVPVQQAWQEKAFFPKSNSRRIAPATTVHWKVWAWRNVDGSYDDVQARTVQAVAFEGDALACYFTITQTRNSSDDDMPIGEYAVTCDDESEELGEHAAMVRAALAQLEGRTWLWAGEATTELSSLFVPPAFKNHKLWRPAMTTLLERLASQNGEDPHVCLLKAKPLETAWRQKALHADEWERSRRGQPPQSEQPTEREEQLAMRRASALQALYERELGFSPLDGPWMARMVEPPPRRG